MTLFSKKQLDKLRSVVCMPEILCKYYFGRHTDIPLENGFFKCDCPFCKSQESFYSGMNHYFCVQCGAHGDGINFLMTFKLMSFEEAIKQLLEDYKVYMKETNSEEFMEKVNSKISQLEEKLSKLEKWDEDTQYISSSIVESIISKIQGSYIEKSAAYYLIGRIISRTPTFFE